MTTTPLCFIDTETLGLDPDLNPVWEVGMILRSGAGPDEEFCFQLPVTEVDIERAHPVALEITRFHERYVRPRQTRAQILNGVFHVTSGCHLVGAVVSFDEERLRREMRSLGMVPGWHYHLIDVEALAVGYLRGLGSRRSDLAEAVIAGLPWNSKELSKAIGVAPPVEAHTALGDARWARDVYDAVVGR